MKNFVKNIALIILINLFWIPLFSQTVVFSEGFEAGALPAGWGFEYVSGTVDWAYYNGGESSYPASAHGGSYNARFYHASYDGNKTKLITPELDLDTLVNPKLKFWYAQDDFGGDQDELRVFYKTSAAGSWVLLEAYTSEVAVWTEKIIALPNTNATYYIAFEGYANYGYGACVDDIELYEPPPVPKSITTLTINQASTNQLLKNSANNPVLRIDVEVAGDDGAMLLNSIELASLCSRDADIPPSGVHLFVTSGTTFSTANPIGSAQSISAGIITFSGIAYDLPGSSTSCIWVAFDIASDAVSDNSIDATILQDKINIDGATYPIIDESPAGQRIIVETIFQDDFETDKGWSFSGEFERNKTIADGGSSGNPDPTSAYSGDTLLGVDLSGSGTFSGDYEASLTDREYVAVSPIIDCYYYRNVRFNFYRWLNIDEFDNAYIDISNDSGATWNQVWSNAAQFVLDDEWAFQELDVSAYADFNNGVQIRFSLGTTDGTNHFSGWNIDDVFFTGDFISRQTGVTALISPASGCGHGAAENVSIVIENFAGDATNDTIPICYSFDGGANMVYDTVFGAIPVGADTQVTFNTPVNLTLKGKYSDVFFATILNADEDTSDDTLYTELIVSPTHTLPYAEDFEQDDGVWVSGGSNSSWEYGSPNAGIINAANSGTNAWVTNLSGNYNANEISWIESPCFDFSNMIDPYIDMHIAWATEPDKDGAAILYSLDEGASWIPLGDVGKGENWYNEDSVQALNTAYNTYPGWNNGTGDWLMAKYLLPDTIENKNNVKFKLVFATDNIIHYNGIGLDDVRIYEVASDIGAVSLVSPSDACSLSNTEIVEVLLSNFGQDTLPAGDSIIISLEFQSLPVISDTLILSSDFFPDDTISYVFNESLDMINDTNYSLKIYTDYHYEINRSNDTISTEVTVFGYPEPELGMDIESTQPDSLVLFPGDFYSYLWQNGSVNDSFEISMLSSKVYHVTVADTNACAAHDSIVVTTTDIGPENVLSPQSACELSSSESIEVMLRNYSADTLADGDTVWVSYTLNGGMEVLNYFILQASWYPDSTLNIDVNSGINMQAIGEYVLNIYTSFHNDVNSLNDTLSDTIFVYGYPTVDLGAAIQSSQADTLYLYPGDYSNYLWQDASTNDTFFVSSMASLFYYVTISDSNGCMASDSVEIQTTDIGIQSIQQPRSACELSANESLQIQLINYSSDTIAQGDTITLSYSVNGGVNVNETWMLPQSLLPDSAVLFIFSSAIPMNSAGAYNIEVSFAYSDDVFAANNILYDTIYMYGLPQANLGADINTNNPDTIMLYPGNFTTYLWQNASTNDTFFVTSTSTAWYSVMVTDSNACTDTDSVKISAHDITLVGLNVLQSACELSDTTIITIEILNSCSDTIFAGDTIQASYSVNGSSVEYEDFFLSSDLLPDSIQLFAFAQPYDMSVPQVFVLSLNAYNNKDVYSDDNSTYDTVTNYGYPIPDLGSDIYSKQADTLYFYPGSFNSYVWDDSTTNDTMFHDTYTSGAYSVTVTDINGCSAEDSVLVYLLAEISVSNLISPENACEHSAIESVSVAIYNNSSRALEIGDTLFTGLVFDSLPLLYDTIILTTIMPVDSFITHTFSSTVDMSEFINHSIIVYSKYRNDIVSDNDTIQFSVISYGYPVTELPDSIYTTQPDTVVLYPGSFASYLWQDSSTQSSYQVSVFGQYSVMVTDANGCSASDTVDLMLSTEGAKMLQGNKFLVYPNPANSYITLEASFLQEQNPVLELYGKYGEKVLSKHLEKTKNIHQKLSLEYLPAGIYFLRITTAQGFVVKKVVVM